MVNEKGEKRIYAFCKQCKKRFAIIVPNDFVIKDSENLYIISHVHGVEGKSLHSLIIELDRNKNVRNTRVSDYTLLAFEL
ncbi:MAG: hypothetical protein RBG13Loki_2541 [Promethearchaeota archaeon CR_4]|nr:MAG: hypothetical protein RBG13Loki_2541 [Candidatus Lokiarchaeota archaeon CR_4]